MLIQVSNIQSTEKKIADLQKKICQSFVRFIKSQFGGRCHVDCLCSQEVSSASFASVCSRYEVSFESERLIASNGIEFCLICRECLTYIEKNITPSSACAVYEFASALNSQQLIFQAINTIDRQTYHVITHKSFKYVLVVCLLLQTRNK